MPAMCILNCFIYSDVISTAGRDLNTLEHEDFSLRSK